MTRKKTSAPRAPSPSRQATLRAPILGKGGAHGKTQKAERAQAKQQLRKKPEH